MMAGSNEPSLCYVYIEDGAIDDNKKLTCSYLFRVVTYK
jgi:hypothetical protein